MNVQSCVRCGESARRSCSLVDADGEVEACFVCEPCIDQTLGKTRYGGIAAAGILLFLGLAIMVGATDKGKAIGLALAFSGVVWGAWTLVNTHDARDETTLRIAREEAPNRGHSPDP